MIILSFLVRGNESSLFPLPPGLVEPEVEPEVEPVDVPEPRDLARLREDGPLSQCWVIVALGEEEPGFVVPKA